MKARLIKNLNDKLALLLEDGEYIESPDTSVLGILLFNFKSIDDFGLSKGESSWKGEYPSISSYPGVTLAYITDNMQLVIDDIAPFVTVFDSVKATVPFDEVITAAEYAEKHNKSVEQVKVFCRGGRIFGARKVGRDWLIPQDAPYPADSRFGSMKSF